MFQVLASVVALCLLVGSDNVTAANKGDILQNVLFSGTYDLIDLTHQVDVDINPWPGGRRFEFTKKTAGRLKDYWYAVNDFCTAEHTGTHIDAPYHFNKEGNTVGYVPVTDLVLPLVIVDISQKVNDDPNFVLYKEHLDNVLNVDEDSKKRYIVIFKFGWAKFYNDTRKYYGNDGHSESGLKFPGLSAEVAEWIVHNYKNVVGVGVDTASVDAPSSANFPAHVTFAKHGLYNIENINLQETLPVVRRSDLNLRKVGSLINQLEAKSMRNTFLIHGVREEAMTSSYATALGIITGKLGSSSIGDANLEPIATWGPPMLSA